MHITATRSSGGTSEPSLLVANKLKDLTYCRPGQKSGVFVQQKTRGTEPSEKVPADVGHGWSEDAAGKGLITTRFSGSLA